MRDSDSGERNTSKKRGRPEKVISSLNIRKPKDKSGEPALRKLRSSMPNILKPNDQMEMEENSETEDKISGLVEEKPKQRGLQKVEVSHRTPYSDPIQVIDLAETNFNEISEKMKEQTRKKKKKEESSSDDLDNEKTHAYETGKSLYEVPPNEPEKIMYDSFKNLDSSDNSSDTETPNSPQKNISFIDDIEKYIPKYELQLSEESSSDMETDIEEIKDSTNGEKTINDSQ